MTMYLRRVDRLPAGTAEQRLAWTAAAWPGPGAGPRVAEVLEVDEHEVRYRHPGFDESVKSVAAGEFHSTWEPA